MRVKLIVDHDEGLAARLDHTGLCFILREVSVVEVGDVWSSPVTDLHGRGDHSGVRGEWLPDVDLLWRRD
jgi:hypothetical protein